MLQPSVIGAAQTIFQRHLWRPAHRAELVTSHQLARCAIGLAEMLGAITVEACDLHNQPRQFLDGDIPPTDTLNRPGNPGGCLVRVRLRRLGSPTQQSRRLRPRPTGCCRWAQAAGDCCTSRPIRASRTRRRQATIFLAQTSCFLLMDPVSQRVGPPTNPWRFT